jgi:thymidylate synthase (FAD)
VIPGFTKDDKYVAKVEEASYVNVVRWLRKLGHWKLFAMPTATFLIEGISRKSALHYLRYEFLITNFQSQKYNPQDQFNYVLPDPGEESPEVIRKIEDAMKQIQKIYEGLRETNCDAEWARIVYPNGTAQTMTMHTNFLQWAHIGRCLLSEEYVQENKKVMAQIMRILKKEAPVFFEDFIEKEDGSWKVPSYNRNVCVNFGLPSHIKKELGIPIIEDLTEIE